MNWTELFARAEQVKNTVLVEALQQERPLLLQPTTRSGSLLLLAVGFLWPFDVLLDEKNLLQDADAFRLGEAQIPQQWLPASALIEGDLTAPEPWAQLEGWKLTLCTSGSTGEPKRIQKTGAGLLAEVRDLAGIYQWHEKDVILSLVSPLHIYGLLHSFLLPWFGRATVEFVSFQDGPVDPLTLSSSHYTGVVAVPATWSFVKDLLDTKTIDTLVMSGAPFGDRRRRELQTLARQPGRAFEILGSTETGGIGVRSLLDADDFFQCLPSVRILAEEGQLWVDSPYVKPASRWPLADRLELLGNGRFLHQGRSDRIFKYAGQRYALGEVEKALSQTFHQAEAFAQFHMDDHVAQGGWLEAWVESSDQTVDAALRQRYHEGTRAPFPHRLHFLPEFPRDTQGKLQLTRRVCSDSPL